MNRAERRAHGRGKSPAQLPTRGGRSPPATDRRTLSGCGPTGAAADLRCSTESSLCRVTQWVMATNTQTGVVARIDRPGTAAPAPSRKVERAACPACRESWRQSSRFSPWACALLALVPLLRRPHRAGSVRGRPPSALPLRPNLALAAFLGLIAASLRRRTRVSWWIVVLLYFGPAFLASLGGWLHDPWLFHPARPCSA